MIRNGIDGDEGVNKYGPYPTSIDEAGGGLNRVGGQLHYAL